MSMRAFLWMMFPAMFLAISASGQIGGGTGWAPLPIRFTVQWPTNAARGDRYWDSNGVFHCRVYRVDGAFTPGNQTKPRTEQRFPDYKEGEIQYQSMEEAPSNENGYCIFQIHTGDAQSHEYGATAFMLFWFSKDGGSVHDYAGRELAANLGNKWFQLNVDHDIEHNSLKVWINGALVWTQQTKEAKDFYFKDGVYVQRDDPSYQMDVNIAKIQMWKRTSSGQ
jgi:hypothetical protein